MIKPTVTIILNGERLNAFPLGSEAKPDHLLSLLFNIVLEVLASVISQKKKKISKRHPC